MNAHPTYEVIEMVTIPALVFGCALYCAWRFAPQPVTRYIRNALLKLPLPAPVKTRLQAPQTTTGCGAGCSGCSAAPGTGHAPGVAERAR